MSDALRVLNLLIHDVRTPLAVAQGYLRLMHDQHLRTPDDVHRALGKSMDALGRIARLCEDAEAVLTSEDPARTSVTVDLLTARVDLRAREAGVFLTRTGVDRTASVSITPDIDRLASAVLIVLNSVAPPAAVYTAVASDGPGDRTLTFMVAPVGPPVSATDLDAAFDPWRGPGLALARACQTVTQAGGRIATAPGPHRAAAITFPLETALS